MQEMTDSTHAYECIHEYVCTLVGRHTWIQACCADLLGKVLGLLDHLLNLRFAQSALVVLDRDLLRLACEIYKTSWYVRLGDSCPSIFA